MCRSYRQLATLLFSLVLPLTLSLIGLWEFVLEPMVHGPEEGHEQIEYFFTSAFFSTLALALASGVVFYLGAKIDRETKVREKVATALERAQRIGQVGSWEWRQKKRSVHLSREASLITALPTVEGYVSEKACLALLPRELREVYQKEMERLLSAHGHFDRVHRIVRPDGAIRHIHTRGESVPHPTDPTRIVGVSGTVHDITERILAEERTRLHAVVFTHSSEAIMVTGPDGLIADINPAFTALTGYPVDEVVGSLPSILKSGKHSRTFYAEMWSEILSKGSWRGEILNKVKNGALVPMEAYISAVHDEKGKASRFVAIFTDVTVRKENEERLRRLSVTDPLTGVANRRAFDDALEHEWRRGMRNHTPMTLLMIDLDKFKEFNDTFGHQEGDRRLKIVADTLNLIVNRPGDLVARYGGEEFVVILPETNQAEGLLIAESMRETILDVGSHTPHHENEKRSTVSIGVATVVPRKGETPEGLIRRADDALYRAKVGGRNRTALADMVDHPSDTSDS